MLAAPLAFGAVHPPAYIPLLGIAYVGGIVSWMRGHWSRAHGTVVPKVPGRRLLFGLVVLALLQVVPLPSRVLGLISPGSRAVRGASAQQGGFFPISVSPADTWRAALFVGGMSILYATVYREFRERRWRRRLAFTVVATAFLAALAGLLQAASNDPGKIYGLWRPQFDWAVFGPYVNRNHFGGYMVLAIPLSLALTIEALQKLAGAWKHRRVGWLALGEPEGTMALRWMAVAMFLVVGLLASRSRGGILGLLASVVVLPLVIPRRRVTSALVIGLVGAAGLNWVDLSTTQTYFETRNLEVSRLFLWREAVRMVPDFPLFGAGLNAFGPAFAPYQTLNRGNVYWGQAHNDYLQVLLDLGVVGAALLACLLVLLFRGAYRSAGRSVLGAGIFGSLLGSAAHAFVDFNWQIPANIATFAALCGLAMQDPEASDP